MTKLNYSAHYETLMAVVTHLGVHKWALRQPQGIAKDLSIPVDDVRVVLKLYKGLFRESVKVSKDHADPFYSLHLRHSRQPTNDDPLTERPALEAEYLFPMLQFIAQKSAQETQGSAALRVATLTSAVSLLVGLSSLGIALLK